MHVHVDKFTNDLSGRIRRAFASLSNVESSRNADDLLRLAAAACTMMTATTNGDDGNDDGDDDDVDQSTRSHIRLLLAANTASLRTTWTQTIGARTNAISLIAIMPSPTNDARH